MLIEPGRPWYGYVESVSGKYRCEFLDGEVYSSLLKAQVLLENRWWEYY